MDYHSRRRTAHPFYLKGDHEKKRATARSGHSKAFDKAHGQLHTAEEFKQLYQKLCQDTGFQIAFEPRWAQSRDQGDYRLVIVTSVIPLPK